MTAGGLSVLLALAGGSSVALTSRSVIATLACVALVAQYVMSPREPTEPHALALLAAPVVATLVAVGARWAFDPRTSSAIALAGIVTACAAAGIWLLSRARHPIDRERERIALGLDQPCHRVVGDELAEARGADLRPGEEIVLDGLGGSPGRRNGDGGQRQNPALVRREDPVPNAPKVIRSWREPPSSRGGCARVAGWAGDDRAWMRLTNDPRRRADLIAPLRACRPSDRGARSAIRRRLGGAHRFCRESRLARDRDECDGGPSGDRHRGHRTDRRAPRGSNRARSIGARNRFSHCGSLRSHGQGFDHRILRSGNAAARRTGSHQRRTDWAPRAGARAGAGRGRRKRSGASGRRRRAARGPRSRRPSRTGFAARTCSRGSVSPQWLRMASRWRSATAH